jgi:hypothetical protein
MIRVSCPKCQKKLGLDDSKAGGVGVCPGCGAKFRVPKPAASGTGPAAPSKKPSAPAKDVGIRAGAKAEAKAKPTPPAAPPPKQASADDDDGAIPYLVVKNPTPPPEPKKRRKQMSDDEIDEIGVDKEYLKKRKKKKKERESSGMSGSLIAAVALLVIWIGMSLLVWLKPDAVLIPIWFGRVVAFIGWVWLLILAFDEGFLFALLVFFLSPIGAIVLCVIRPYEAMKPCMVHIAGWLIQLTAALIYGMHIFTGTVDLDDLDDASLTVPTYLAHLGWHASTYAEEVLTTFFWA